MKKLLLISSILLCSITGYGQAMFTDSDKKSHGLIINQDSTSGSCWEKYLDTADIRFVKENRSLFVFADTSLSSSLVTLSSGCGLRSDSNYIPKRFRDRDTSMAYNIDSSFKSQGWEELRQYTPEEVAQQKVFRMLYIYSINDSVSIVDSPYLHGNLFDDSQKDTMKYVVSTWLYATVHGKCVNSVGRGESSCSYVDYLGYINREMLWEIWMDRGKRDYWLYGYGGRRRVSFKNSNIKRAFLTMY